MIDDISTSSLDIDRSNSVILTYCYFEAHFSSSFPFLGLNRVAAWERVLYQTLGAFGLTSKPLSRAFICDRGR